MKSSLREMEVRREAGIRREAQGVQNIEVLHEIEVQMRSSQLRALML